MEAITLEKQANRFVISIEEGYINKDALTQLIERLKWEHLIEKADFDEDIVAFGEEIKANWWAQNKERFLGKAE